MTTVVLITGANSGVGLATVKVLASSSSHFHIFAAGRSLPKVEAALKTIESPEILSNITPIKIDVTSEDTIKAAASLISQRFGRLDVLINNAGVTGGSEDLKARHDNCFNTNVLGPVLMSHAFRPLLLNSQDPRSIYISSGVGSMTYASDPTSSMYRGPPGGEAYRASKAALNMHILQEVVTLEGEAKEKLKIFAVCPGWVKSNLAGEGTERTRLRNASPGIGDPEDSGRVVLSVIKGERDADVGKFLHKDGLHPW